jgi:hypothetical protein
MSIIMMRHADIATYLCRREKDMYIDDLLKEYNRKNIFVNM